MKAILLGIWVLSFTDSIAQGLGAEAGINFNRISATINGEHVTSSFRPGFRGGLVADEVISDKLSFRYGLFYSAKGGNIAFTHHYTNDGVAIQRNVSGYMRIDYAEMPLSLLYNYPTTERGHFFIGGGVYLGYATGGIVGFTSSETVGTLNKQITSLYPASIGSDPTDDFQTFDMGVQGQIGYEHRSGIYAKAGFFHGLMNIAPSAARIQNQSLDISLGYMIR